MGLGHNNYYRMDTIMPRHFHETAKEARLPEPLVDNMLKELKKAAPDALATTSKSTANEVPQKLITSIKTGVLKRADLI